jgi:Phage tail tube protein
MARSKGFQGIYARKKGSAWGTAVAAGAGDGIDLVSIDVGDAGTDAIEDMQITGEATQRESSPGIQSVSPTMSSALRFEGHEKDIAQVLGTAGAPSTVDTTAKLHVLKIAKQIDGIFNTMAYEYVKDTAVAEVASVKWNKLVLSGQQSQKWMITISGLGFQWINTSAINTTTTIDTVTETAGREFALFSQSSFLLNGQGGAGLVLGTDDVWISGFELTIERGMDPRVSTQFGDRPDEPIDNGFLKVSGKFTVPAIQNVAPGGNMALFGEQVTLTRKKGTLTITSPNLAGSATAKYLHKIWLPNLQLGKGRPGIPGPQGPTMDFPFTAFHVTAIPTGFTAGYTQAVIWENQSKWATDALA